jgi:hypothetical protein
MTLADGGVRPRTRLCSRRCRDQQLTPAAPFVHVTIRPPEQGIAVSDLPALWDTAADITLIPARIAEELHLIPLDEPPIGGFDGRVSWVPTFLIQLALR